MAMEASLMNKTGMCYDLKVRQNLSLLVATHESIRLKKGARMPSGKIAVDTLLLAADEPANLQVLMETLGGTVASVLEACRSPLIAKSID